VNALTFLKGLVALVSSVAKYLSDKRLIELGAADSVLKGLQDAEDAITRANTARANANSVPISEDPDDRSRN
jgi:hypothetical protein